MCTILIYYLIDVLTAMMYYVQMENLVNELIERMVTDFNFCKTDNKKYLEVLKETQGEDISLRAFSDMSYTAGINMTCENQIYVKIHGRYFTNRGESGWELSQQHFHELVRQLTQIWGLQRFLV